MISDEQRFNDGMGAKLNGFRLQWVEPEQWIQVDDIPTAMINEMKQQPYYAACMLCENYLNVKASHVR